MPFVMQVVDCVENTTFSRVTSVILKLLAENLDEVQLAPNLIEK